MSLSPKQIAQMSILEIEEYVRAQSMEEIKIIRPLRELSLKRREKPVRNEIRINRTFT